MNDVILKNVCRYFSVLSPGKITSGIVSLPEFEIIDDNTFKYINNQSSNMIKVFITIVYFKLTPNDCKYIITSGIKQKENENYIEYKQRVKTIMYFDMCSSKIYRILGIKI